MFNEKLEKKNTRTGWIEVIAGSMFSGKTEELIRRLRRAQYARQRIEIFKPSVDIRYSKIEVVSHNEVRIHSTPVNSSLNIMLLSEDIDVVGIDEAQFFDDGLPEVCTKLTEKGIRVIVAGLDMDFKGRPFGPMPALCAIAEDVTKVHAICIRCGDLAQFSHRKVASDDKVLLGETDSYEPLCRRCYIEALKKENSE
ncbi:MAG: thymidine kinase [Bacteroidales bacterium]